MRAKKSPPTKKNNPAGDKPEVPAKPDTWQGTLSHLGGSKSDQWNNRLANDTVLSLWVANANDEVRQVKQGAALAALIGIAPKTELEGMMAAQLIAAHSAAMECYRRAMIGEQTFEGRQDNLNQASKLSRTFVTLLEALNRHRGKGQQKVTVEHVHVHAGGQAVVGVVEPRGGGDQAESKDQPHAKQIAHAPGVPMPSTDATRDRMPVTSDAERPLPDARRTIDGGAEG